MQNQVHIHTYIHRYITLHYITLHYTTLHYITLHYTTLHYITLHYIHTYIYIYHILFSFLWENKHINSQTGWGGTEDSSPSMAGRFGRQVLRGWAWCCQNFPSEFSRTCGSFRVATPCGNCGNCWTTIEGATGCCFQDSKNIILVAFVKTDNLGCFRDLSQSSKASGIDSLPGRKEPNGAFWVEMMQTTSPWCHEVHASS